MREKRKNADQKLSLSVTNMLREFAQRRNQASLKMLHEIHNKQVYVDDRHLTITQNNRYLMTHLKTKHHMNSFFPLAMRLWNGLPTDNKNAPTVMLFSIRLDTFYAF